MTDPIRALCAELADAYLRLLEHINNSTRLGYEPSDDPLLLRARAALAEPVAEPPEGEVAKLVAQLRELAEIQDDDGWEDDAVMLRRAAELLERHAAPVPVSERLPGPEDCDREGFIWLWDSDRRWVRQHREAASSNTWVGSLWLPGHALPLPAPQGGEVEP